MPGHKCIYITNTGQVFKISNADFDNNKPIPELAGENVLEVLLYYETRNRKPWRIKNIFFSRITLNSEGQYVMSDEDILLSFRNFEIFGLTTVENLCERKDPLPIPTAPIIPTKTEKNALVNHLKTALPKLWENDPYAVERIIEFKKQLHEEDKRMVKNISSLRKLQSINKRPV